MLTPFMPCGAKLPVIALFSGAFFADASWVGTLMYFVGILLILLGAARGEMDVVLRKAANLCMECIGIG